MGVQAKMAFANNILVVGVVLALAVRSSWELGDKVFDVQLLGSIEIIPNTTTTASTSVTTPTTTAAKVTTATTTAANATTATTTAANVTTATTTAANVTTVTTAAANVSTPTTTPYTKTTADPYMKSEEKSKYMSLNSGIAQTLRQMLPKIVEATGSNLTIGTMAI